MIDIILTKNTRPACAGPRLIRYSAGGVFSALVSQGWKVRFIDLMQDKDFPVGSYDDSADVLCYAVFFGNKANAFHHMEKVRHAKKASQVIIAFGPFAAAFPGQIISRNLADIVVSGDPEFTIPELLDKIENRSAWKTIPNISYLKDGAIVHTSKDLSHDLDDIPFISPFFCSQGDHPAFMMTARGCRHYCVFCDRNALWGGGVRQRSISNVLAEIQKIVDTYCIKQLDLFDEDLAADHKFLAGLCKGIRDMKAKFFWTCSVCVDSVNKELLWLMARSGCEAVYFGMESASEPVLRRMGKTYDQQQIMNAVQWAQEAGLKVDVMITTGNPGETEEDKSMTLSTLKEMGPNVNIITNRLIVLPGTVLYKRGLRDGLYTERSYFEEEELILYNEERQR